MKIEMHKLAQAPFAVTLGYMKLNYFQEDYHVADLRKELQTVKKLLADERLKSDLEEQRVGELQSLFGQIFKDYTTTIDSLKHLHQKKKMEVNKH